MKNQLLDEIVKAFINTEYDDIPILVRKSLDESLEPIVILNDGLVKGIREVGEQFQRGEVFLPEMMLSVEAWESGISILTPLMIIENTQSKGTIVIGTVKNDIHSLGKNIVINLLKTEGFEIIDLGVDVSASTFVSKATEKCADIIALCALMTTTMPQQKEVIEHLIAADMRKDYFVMVGGASTTQEWADEINADAYGETAWDAVTIANQYIKKKLGASHDI